MTSKANTQEVPVQSKSARIRELVDGGMKIGPAAKEVGVSYQRAYNTIKNRKPVVVQVPAESETGPEILDIVGFLNQDVTDNDGYGFPDEDGYGPGDVVQNS